MSTKGYPTQDKDDRLIAQHWTLEPIRENQHGISVNSHEFVELIGTDTAEASSSTYVINATAHAARVGDVIRFTSGTHSGREVKVWAVATNSITLAETLSSSVATGVTFQILRHRYPIVNSSGELITSATITPSPIQYVLDGVDTEVEEDTVTPANNRPLPVKILGASGEVQITAGNLDVQLTHSGANPDSVRIGDGTETVNVTASNQMEVAVTASLPAGTNAIGKLSANDGVDIGDVTINNAAGASAVNIQDGGNSITVDGTVAATQSGTWNINDISGTVSLPTGASTSANQTNGSQKAQIVDGGGDVLSISASGEASALVTNGAGASAVNIQDGGNSITVDGTVAATQSGTWTTRIVDGSGNNITAASNQLWVDVRNASIPVTQSGTWSTRTQDGSGNSLTSVAVGSNRALHTQELGFTSSEFVRNDYSSVNVTTAAYTQLIASTAAEYQEIEIFDSSGQTLKLATGAAASEVDRLLIFPGGNGRIKFRIASGTRIAIRAVSATASVGEVSINFYG